MLTISDSPAAKRAGAHTGALLWAGAMVVLSLALSACGGTVLAPDVVGEAVPIDAAADDSADDAAPVEGADAEGSPADAVPSGGLEQSGGPDLPPPPAPPWETATLAEHPLVGRVWSVADGTFVDAEAALYRLAEADFVMLGEKHDNPDHHRIQAWLVEGMLNLGRKPAVAFEQFTDDREEALYDHLTLSPTDAAGIADAVGWQESGWPEWSMYQPIAQAALNADAPLLAANPSDSLIMGVSGMGEPPDAEQRARLGLDEPLPSELQAALEQEIVDSHCGYLPAEMAPPMADAQRARDGGMAERIVRAATELPLDGAILITGNGHARTDRGVPLQITRRAPAATISSAAMLEVVDTLQDPAAYGESFDGALPFDFLFFTPRLDDIDPCEKFADQLQQMGGGDEGEEGDEEGAEEAGESAEGAQDEGGSEDQGEGEGEGADQDEG